MHPALERHLRPVGVRPAVVAAAIGAAWGIVGYTLLWGLTPVVVHRAFVVSVPGTLLLLPVRLVLWGIHLVEEVAAEPFDFSRNHGWIGILAGVVGAGMAVGATALTRTVVRRVRAARA